MAQTVDLESGVGTEQKNERYFAVRYVESPNKRRGVDDPHYITEWCSGNVEFFVPAFVKNLGSLGCTDNHGPGRLCTVFDVRVLQNHLIPGSRFMSYINDGEVPGIPVNKKSRCRCHFCAIPSYEIGSYRYLDEQLAHLLYSLMGEHYFVADIVFAYLGKVGTIQAVHRLLTDDGDISFAMSCISPRYSPPGSLARVAYTRRSLRVARLVSVLEPWVLQHQREEVLLYACSRVFERLRVRAIKKLARKWATSQHRGARYAASLFVDAQFDATPLTTPRIFSQLAVFV